MVKIHDPRADTAAISMRILRAKTADNCIKNCIKRNKIICEDKLKKKLNEIDSIFGEDFDNCSCTVKQELIFLWEEVGDLNSRLDNLESSKDNTETEENFTDIPIPPESIKNHLRVPKRLRLFGP